MNYTDNEEFNCVIEYLETIKELSSNTNYIFRKRLMKIKCAGDF